MEGKTPDITVVLRLAEKIAAGLTAAHKLGIVHRDIKPDNILVTEDGEPKILDFGLAKPAASDPESSLNDSTDTISRELTKAGKILGTVGYMSPEQARGDTIDTRSDIFSFGVMLYRLTSGTMPFDGGSQVGTLAKILEAQHDSVRTKNENVPQELERIIDKCLRKDANDRYQDTRDLVVDLRNLRRQFDSGVTDLLSGMVDRPSGIQTKKTGVTLFRYGIMAVALLVVAIAAIMWLRRLTLETEPGGEVYQPHRRVSTAWQPWVSKTKPVMMTSSGLKPVCPRYC